MQLCGSIFTLLFLALAIEPEIWWGYKWREFGHFIYVGGDDDEGASTAKYDDDYGIGNFHAWSLWDVVRLRYSNDAVYLCHEV